MRHASRSLTRRLDALEQRARPHVNDLADFVITFVGAENGRPNGQVTRCRFVDGKLVPV